MNEAKLKQMLKEKHGVDVPPDAKLLKRTVTDKFETFVFQHISGSYLIDGDRIVVKISKSGNPGVLVPERRWSEGLIPPPAPPRKEKKGIAVLINPNDPYYIWLEKPPKFHPCWLIEHKAEVTIIDIASGKTIGYGTPVPMGSDDTTI